jgi:hypothetical protein
MSVFPDMSSIEASPAHNIAASAESSSGDSPAVSGAENMPRSADPTSTATPLNGATPTYQMPRASRASIGIHGAARQDASSAASAANVIPNGFFPQQFPTQNASHVRLSLGGGNVVTVPLQRHDRSTDGIATGFLRHGNVNVRLVQMDPLVAQPLEDSGYTTAINGATGVSNGDVEQQAEDPALSRFKCDICYDFLKVFPVGCGKCTARFCQGCLHRVYQDELQRRVPHKCPMCRVEYQAMVNDEALRREMDAGPKVPCRYSGCPAQNLRLSMITEHEKMCEHVPVRCRYALYGCSWTGKRGILEEHELSTCRVSPVGPFVEQFRQFRAEIVGRLDMTSQQVAGASRVQGSIRQTLARDQIKSSADVIELLHYCHCLTCSTPTALLQKDKWLSFWRNGETRASVVNFLVFLPFLIPSFTIGAQGLSSLCLAMDKLLIAGTKMMSEDSNSSLSFELALSTLLTPQTERLIETALIGFCTATFGALAIALNLTDEKSSKTWRGIKVGQLGTPPIIGDVLGICIFALLMCITEYHDGGVRAIVLFFLILFSSTIFPSLILTLSHYVATVDPPPPSDLPHLARSIEPLMFGLRYSFLEANFGMSACLDAAIMVPLLSRPIEQKFFKDCFVGQLPEVACVAFFGFKLALWGANAYNHLTEDASVGDVFSTIADSFFAVVTLRLLNEVVYGAFKCGIKVGCLIASQSRRYVRPEGIAKDYSVLGIIAFGTWFVALFGISQI